MLQRRWTDLVDDALPGSTAILLRLSAGHLQDLVHAATNPGAQITRSSGRIIGSCKAIGQQEIDRLGAPFCRRGCQSSGQETEEEQNDRHSSGQFLLDYTYI